MRKVAETHREKKMYLETQDGLDFTLKIFHDCCLLSSVPQRSSTDDSKRPSLIGPPEPWWHGVVLGSSVNALTQDPDEMRLCALLGGAVMLLVYEYTYEWLQKNW